MSDDRRTKAQLIEALANAEREAAELRGRVPARPEAVPEADALAACIRALDGLKRANRDSFYEAGSPPVTRTILALCEKYNVSRNERVTEPCTRRHMEDMTAMDVISAIKRDFEGMELS